LLFTGAQSGSCTLWDWKKGGKAHSLRGHSDRINAASFAHDGQSLITASDDRLMIVWNVETGSRIHTLKHPGAVTSLAVSADGRWAVSICRDERQGRKQDTGTLPFEMRLWDIQGLKNSDESEVLANAEPVQIIQIDAKRFSSVAFADDGKEVITSVSDYYDTKSDKPGNGVVRWTLGAANPVGKLKSMPNNEVFSAVFSPDGKSALTVGRKTISIWDPDFLERQRTFSPNGDLTDASYSFDGKFIVTGSSDGSFKVWDAQSGRSLYKLEGRLEDAKTKKSFHHEGRINSAQFSPKDGSYRLLTADSEGTAILWNWEPDQKKVSPLQEFSGHSGSILDARFSSDEKKIVTASSDGTARVWNTVTGGTIFVLKGHTSAVLCAIFSADGKWVSTGSSDTTARIWNMTTGKEFLGEPLYGHSAAVTSVAFSPSSNRLLTGSEDSTAKLWDARTGEATVNLDEPDADADSKKKPGKDLLALKSGRELLTLRGHSEGITSVTFSPNGYYILTGSNDGTAILWLAENPEDSK